MFSCKPLEFTECTADSFHIIIAFLYKKSALKVINALMCDSHDEKGLENCFVDVRERKKQITLGLSLVTFKKHSHKCRRSPDSQKEPCWRQLYFELS